MRGTSFSGSVSASARARRVAQSCALALALMAIAPASPVASAEPFSGRFEGYAITEVTPGIIQLDAPTNVLLASNEMTEQFDLGFTSRLFDDVTGQFWVSSNGFISLFKKEDPGCCGGQAIPDPKDPDGLVAGFWADLDPSAGGRIDFQRFTALALKGLAPQRAVVVSYTDVRGPGGETNNITNTFQIIVLEDGAFEIRIDRAFVPGGRRATIGLENFNGAEAHTILHGDALSLENEAWRVTPIYRPYTPDLVLQSVDVMPPSAPNVPWRVTVTVTNADIGPIYQATIRVVATAEPGPLRGTSPGCPSIVGQKPVLDLDEGQVISMTFSWSPPLDSNNPAAMRVGDFNFAATGVVVASAEPEVNLANNAADATASYLVEGQGGTDVLCMGAPEVGA